MRVLISGGGTGGHLFPAIAVAQALSRNASDAQVLYVGRRGGIEEQVVPDYGVPMETIVAAKLDMEQVWRNWSVPFVVPRALAQAIRIVRRFLPDVVLGTGGYVSAPVILAAAMRRVPVVLQEQNALPGRTTRWLSRVAQVVATAYPETGRYLHSKSVVTGTPVRDAFWKPRTDFPARPRRLLVLGGSQGAHRINQAVLSAVGNLNLITTTELEVWHQTGEKDYAWIQSERDALEEPVRERYHPFKFSNDLPDQIYQADLVLVAKQLGNEVTGSDEDAYPPTTDILTKAGIKWVDGHAAGNVTRWGKPDLVVQGNQVREGNPETEAARRLHIRLVSEAEYWGELTADRFRIVVAGSAGKTTTASLTSWILSIAGRNPGLRLGSLTRDLIV